MIRAMQTDTGLLEKAREASGLDDFGEQGFRDGLGRLLFAIEREGQLNTQGQARMEQQIIGLLTCRLEIERWYGEYPEIEDQEIVRPLIGLGLPRTGSTALSFLLAEDPQARSIRAWESTMPCPPPETATQSIDPRIEVLRSQMVQMDQLSPRFKTMLPQSVAAPSECQYYMAYDFKSQVFQAFVKMPSYVNWLNYEADLVPTYTYVKRVLKLLQWRCPPARWRLKNPAHMLFINALDKVFPDARYWMTHRDITRVIPSVVDLYCELSRPYSDTIDIDWIREMNLDWTEAGLHRVMQFRKDGNDQRFFDIDFVEMQAEPIKVMERLYSFLGEELTPDARTRMVAWKAENAANRPVKDETDLTSLGINLEKVRKRFAFYREK